MRLRCCTNIVVIEVCKCKIFAIYHLLKVLKIQLPVPRMINISGTGCLVRCISEYVNIYSQQIVKCFRDKDSKDESNVTGI